MAKLKHILVCFVSSGDRHASSVHDHVILPKQITDDFYATLTHCYEELFQASFPKYVPKCDTKDDTELTTNNIIHPTHKTSSDVLRHTSSDVSDVIFRRKDVVRDLNQRLSLDLSQLDIDWNNDSVVDSTFARKYTEADIPSEPKRTPDHVINKDKSYRGKWLPGRRKAYKLNN